MKKLLKIFLALLLSFGVFLSGCSGNLFAAFLQDFADTVQDGLIPSFEEMVYTRPTPDEFCSLAEETATNALQAKDAEVLMDAVYRCYNLYYSFYTNYMLANIHYCADITDTYWDAENSYCLSQTTQVDAAMDTLLYALADSPVREMLEAEEYFGEGFFEAYQGESLWDEGFTALMEQEAELLSQYYELSSQSVNDSSYSDAYFSTWGVKFSQLFAQLVALRQEIAAYCQYDSYVEFAYDYYYTRDYTPQQAKSLTEGIAKDLTPLYKELPDNIWAAGYIPCTEEESLAYVEAFSEKMGGVIQDAFQLMQNKNLYDNRISSQKYDASFEIYLESYYAPYVFLNPSGSARDKLTFAHEFGHFCTDYAASGTGVGIDVAEIFSQSMEYLSLRYTQGYKPLEQMKLADSLSTMVEQSAYAYFEHQLYLLPSQEITPENIQGLYEATGKLFGFDSLWNWDSRDYVMIPHFFTNPLYIISYVVSNDAAMQIYQLELTESGKGLSLLMDSLDTQQTSYLAFLQEVGLTDSFAPGRSEALKETLKKGIWG